VFEGMAIYNTINQAKDKIVNTTIEGLAASMGSVIALAGDYISMIDNSLFMIHNPRGMVAGEKKDMEKVGEVLDKIKSQIMNIYNAKTGIPIADLEKMMDDETWLDAKEALAKGFIDNIIEENIENIAASFDLDKFEFKNLEKYNELKNKIKPKTKNEGSQDMELTLEILKAQFPEVYEAAIAEVKPAHIEEGRVAGKKEGAAEGAANERKRIQDIEGIKAEGFENVIAENKFKPEASKDSVSALIVEAQNKAKEDAAKNRKDDAAAAGDAAQKTDNSAPAGKDDEKEEDNLAAAAAGAVNDARGFKSE